MKDKTKRTLVTLFGSIISNERAMDGAKTFPWWVAVILFVVGTFLPIIPIMVNTSKTYGALFISNRTYNYERYLTAGATTLKSAGVEFKLESYNLNEYINGELQGKTYDASKTVQDDETPIFVYYGENGQSEERLFEIYYSNRPTYKGVVGIDSLRTKIESVKYVAGTDEVFDKEVHDKKSLTYKPSYLLLYKDGFYSKNYMPETTTAVTATYERYDWKHSEFDELLKTILTVEGIDTPDIHNNDYTKGVLENFKKIANEAYLNRKTYNFWFTSGLYWGIYLLLGGFMGMMMWLLTRGKNNPNRNLTIFVGIKISWWIDFTPGLLAMIVGFLWSSAAGLAYIVLIGIRTMWLSMRQLNPAPTQQ